MILPLAFVRAQALTQGLGGTTFHVWIGSAQATRTLGLVSTFLDPDPAQYSRYASVPNYAVSFATATPTGCT